MCISMTIDLNGKIISDFNIMIDDIIWREMTVSGSDFYIPIIKTLPSPSCWIENRFFILDPVT